MNTILIVEDEVDLAELLRDLFELRGYRVVLAFDGQEGLSKAMSEPPDVVLTDVMMPFVDGLELIDSMHRNPATRRVPIIAMSATEDIDYRPFVRKPFAFTEMLKLVERVLKKRR